MYSIFFIFMHYRTREAQIVYERALEFDDGNPDIYYNVSTLTTQK